MAIQSIIPIEQYLSYTGESLKFSVVLPVHNVEKYIERCLLSLLNQELSEFEMVFVDDCGFDQSIRVVEKYAETDSRIKIIKNHRNLGTYHARRIGVENAQGDYIVFLDPDDELHPRTLKKLSENINGNPDLVFFGSRRVPEPKPWVSKPKLPSIRGDEARQELLFKITRCRGLRKGTEGKAFNRNYLEQVYCYLNASLEDRLIYGEDKLLFFGATIKLSKAASIHEDLYVYHKNESSITVANSTASVTMRSEQIDKVIANIVASEVDEAASVEIKNEILKGLAVDKLRLQLAIHNGFFSVIKLYLNVFWLTKSVRDLAKLSVFIVSNGRVKI